jgi:hypothetical protein
MSVRAKLVLVSVKDYWDRAKTLRFEALYDSTIPKDRRFQEGLPKAHAKFQIDNPEALKQFEIGGHYYVDFTPAPKPGE